MRLRNRLFEIAKISKYNKYITNSLVPAINKKLSVELVPNISGDDYTYNFSSITDIDGAISTLQLRITTNNKNIEDGIAWATLIIMGRRYDAGVLTGDINTDVAIIEDSYYDFIDHTDKYHLPRY